MAIKRNMESIGSAIGYLGHLQRSGDSTMGMKMINKRMQLSKTLFRKDLYAHYGCVNAVEFSDDGEWLVSGGDDKRVLMWNVDKALSGLYFPKAMKGEHNSNIFCLGFDSKHTKLFSAGNDEQVILHDVATGETLDVFLHDEAVYGLSVDPVNENVFASACDDGQVLIWDVRANSNDAFVLAGYSSAFHAVMYNPVEPRLIATANAKEGVGLWDVRKPRCCLQKYGGTLLNQSAMSVRFNSMGSHILALRRRLPPVLYELGSVHAAAEFDHREYYNSCTMKSCCFAGDNDQYVLSGSDDFKLYMWKIPDNISTKKGIWVSEAHLVLRGHRSIVNQVRYNSTYGILASSGVEKIVKLWNTFCMSGSGNMDYVSNKDGLRKVYSHEEYINLVLESGQFMTHDYSHHSVQEDPRMMAFFDSLVQRDIEGWTSDSSETSATTDALNTCFEVQSSESSSTSSLSSDSSSSDGETQEEKSQNSLLQPEPPINNSGLSPITQNYLSSLRQLAEASGENNTEDIDENGNLTSDRISMLIAKKRCDQMLKTARATLKLKKHFKMMKHSKSSKSSFSNFNHRTGSMDSARKVLSKVIQNQLKDKRKLLQKKRAKLYRLGNLSDYSSDSDVGNEVSVSSQITVHSNSAEINLSLENGLVPKQDTDILEENETTVNNVTNGVISNFESANEDGVEISCVPNTSTNGLNGDSSSNTVSVGSSNTVFFQPKSGKHKTRNYRKRSAEDLPDDF